MVRSACAPINGSWVTMMTVLSLVVQAGEHLHDLGAGLRVEVAGRLVAEQDGRVVDKCPRYCNPLLLASREFRGFVFCHFPVNADIGKQLADPSGGIVAPVLEDVRVFHVLVRGEERDEVELLEDIADRVQAKVRQSRYPTSFGYSSL